MASIRASEKGLQDIDRARRRKGWNVDSLAWADAAQVSPSTLKRFQDGKAIRQENFVNICQALGLDWQEIADDRLDESSRQKWLLNVKAVIQEGEEPLMEQLFQLIHQLSGDVSVKKQKIEPGFDQYWQPVELVLPPSTRGKEEPARAKKIDFGLGRVVVLAIALTPESDDVVGAAVEVYPVKHAIHLPPGLQGSILDESGEIVPDLQARTGNATDSLKWEFALEPEEIFGVRLELDNVSITESFSGLM